MIGQRSITLSNDNKRFRKRKQAPPQAPHELSFGQESSPVSKRVYKFTFVVLYRGEAGVMNIELVKVFTMLSNELIYP